MNEGLVYGLSILIFISCLMPFVSISIFGINQSVNFISGDGIIVIILLIISCILTKFKKYMISMISSILSCLVVIYDMINSSNVANGMANLSIGAYLCLIFTLALAILGIYVFIENKKIK